MNYLKDYIFRSLPEQAPFLTRPSLRQKVGENGEFLPFRGNTVVFPLDSETKAHLAELQERLHTSDMLASPLDPSTFHMTLHDLENTGGGEENLEERMEEAARKARPLLKPVTLSMEATAAFNMVNTSIVLGLAPADRETEETLDGLYQALETVVPLGYDLTPHITLAYFRPGSYGQESLDRLRALLGPVELKATLRNPVLRTFTSMNEYR